MLLRLANRAGAGGAGAAAAAVRRMGSKTAQPITVAHGDGIGPEIMASTLDVLKAAGANLAIETIDIGEKLYLSGHSSGIAPEAWESLRRTKVFLKGERDARARARARARAPRLCARGAPAR